MVKEGWFGFGSHARLEIQHVERHPDKSVLRFFVTSLAEQATVPSFGVAGVAGRANLHFMLVDPVGRKLYYPLYDDTETTVGSQASASEPGVRYEAVLHFPPVPAHVTTLTVVSPGTAGEFTGVPVADAPPGTTPGPLGTPAWPVFQPQGQPRGEVHDLYDVVEDPESTTVTGSSDKTIALRTDVLFAFDSDRLTAKAKAELDDLAGAMRQEAASPVHIEGHTDGKGSHDYNADLSLRRARAVHAQLQARLGTGHQYQTEGKGETEPVAKEGGADDAQARRRNRRVEISYRLRQPGGTPAPTEYGRAARFRERDGETVASREADFADNRRRIDVKPFYRDGRYLVAVFDITNLGPSHVSWMFAYPGATGGTFGSFGVLDPATGRLYRGVRVGPDKANDYEDAFVDPGRAHFRLEPGTTNRGFMYVPAPPANVTSVTFDAGEFGRIPGIPIRD